MLSEDCFHLHQFIMSYSHPDILNFGIRRSGVSGKNNLKKSTGQSSYTFIDIH